MLDRMSANRTYSRWAVPVIMLLHLGLGVAFSADFSVRAYVDRPQVAVGEQFTLSVELSGSDADDADEPALPSTERFASYLGSGSSSSIQIINGRMSSSKTLNFYYRADREGSHEIGPVSVSVGGETKSTEPISLEIVKGRSGPVAQGPRQQGQLGENDLFVKATASKTRAYVNEAIIVSYKIYTRVDIAGYSLSEVPDRSGFWVEDLLIGQQSAQPSVEIVDGVRYTVATLQKMALFPTTAGPKTLSPLVLDCDVRVRRASRSIFDDSFFDPFGRTARFTVRSSPLKIEVLPLPEAGKPQDFQGAVGQFRLKVDLDKRQVEVNDVVTLKLKLSGSGNIKALPAPRVSFSKGLESYDPKTSEQVKATENSISGSRDYEYVLVPRAGGMQRIEAIRYPYFDPDRESYEVAVVDPIEISVSAGQPSLSAALPGGEGPRRDVRLLAQEIRFIKLRPGSFQQLDAAFYERLLFWIVLFVPLLAIPAAAVYRRRADRLSGDIAYARDRRARKLAQQRLAGARARLKPDQHREFFAECGKALRGYGADKLNLAEAGLISEQLEARLLELGIAASVVDSYLGKIGECDRRQFSPMAASLDEMQQFIAEAEEAILALHRELS